MLHKDTLYYGCIPLLQICTFLWQVKYKRTDMLNHKLVQTWIDYKLRDVVPELVIYMLLYILFLANLTTFLSCYQDQDPSLNIVSILSFGKFNWNKHRMHVQFRRFPTARKLTPKIANNFCPLFFCDVKIKLYPVTYYNYYRQSHIQHVVTMHAWWIFNLVKNDKFCN